MKILKANEELALTKYLYYLMQTIHCDHDTHKRYWIQTYSKIKVAIPDVTEQQRIVTKIEELFSKLDKGIEELNKIKEQLKIYRQAVLKEAFEVVTNEVFMDSVSNMIDPHPSHRTPPVCDDGIPYVGIGDIDYENRKIDFINARKVSQEVLIDHTRRYELQNGDFIMGKIGTIGKPFLLPSPQKYALSANVILIQPLTHIINPKFLYWQFASPFITKQLTLGATATSQPAFGITKARLLKIKMCDMTKQHEIVDIIEKRLSVCDKIVQTVNESLQKAESLKQSILKQAFEGKLV